MTEILTESFCERCGTRYTFESVAPKQRRIGGIKTLGRGLKNFVMSDDSSLDEAMAAARSDAERESTAQQLDAFHRTFNFCMSCRQYTCGNCWNGVEARCLSCAPLATDLVTAEAEAEAAVDLDRLMRLMQPQAEPDWSPAAEAPELIGSAEAAAHAGMDVPEAVAAEAEAEELAAPAPADEQPASGLPAWATTPPRSPEIEVPVEVVAELPSDAAPLEEPAAAVVESPFAGEPEPEPAEAAVMGLEPGESLEDAIAAYEASLQATPAAPAAPEVPVVEAPAAALGASEEPVAEVGSAAEPEPPAAAEVELPAGPGPGVDLVEQPTWPIPAVRAEPELAPEPEPEVQVTAPEAAAPDVAATEPAAPAPAPISVEPEPQPFPVAATSTRAAAPESPPAPPAPARPTAPALPTFAQPPTPAGPPQWPTGPRWPTGIPARESLPTPAAAPGPAAADPLAAIMARQVTEAMWAASSRDVLQPPLAAPASTAAVQPCVSCGISLSATARFCRRCGTPQSA